MDAMAHAPLGRRADDPLAVTPEQALLAHFATQLYGPILIGMFFDLVLLGVGTMQVYIYYQTFKKDRMWIKYYIAVLFIANLVNSSFDMAFLYITLVKHFGFTVVVVKANWLFFYNRALSGFLGLMVQLFFGWRIFILTGSRILALLILLLSSAGFGGSLSGSIIANRMPTYAELHKVRPEAILWHVGTTMSFIIITASLVWFLRRHKTGFSDTDTAMDRIIRVSMQTGLVISVLGTVNIILFLTISDKSGAHLALNVVISKLYVNSLLSSLNMRRNWQFSSYNHGPSVPDDPSMQRGVSHIHTHTHTHNEGISLGTISRAHSHPQIFITVESHQDRDGSIFDQKVNESTPSTEREEVGTPLGKTGGKVDTEGTVESV